MKKQTKFLEETARWAEETTDDGTKQVYYGPQGVLGLDYDGDVSNAEVRDGLVITNNKDIRTTYDLVFGQETFDNNRCLGKCVKQHTFKDKLLKDGKPNPKPTVVETPGQWEFITYKEMKLQARALGLCLREECGIAEREKIAIWSANCVEWMLCDLACSAYSWTSVSVYDTLGPNAASYIVADSGAQVLVCEEKTFKSVPKLLQDEIYSTNPGKDLKVVVCIGTADAATQAALEESGLRVVSFGDAVGRFKDQVQGASKDTPPKPDDILTIMYTSGTTGMPKGVMLQHSNIVSTVSMIDLSPSISITHKDVHLSYLPLAHIFERQICMGVLAKGASIQFASQGAKGLLADLGVVRPTVFAGVPKVYENVRDAVMRKMVGFKKKLFDRALAAKSRDIETGSGYCCLWDLLVFKKTKAALGGRVRFCLTGGAPISKETLTFVMCALGPVVQGYGATETSAASTITMSFDLNVGHVGPPIGTAAIRLVDVPDMNYFNAGKDQYSDAKTKDVFDAGKNKSGGEVWIGGPGVSIGYYDPSVNGIKEGIPTNGMSKKTIEEFFKEGEWSWFKTGDIGSWTPEGCLKIVDRRKNMFKTSLGEYVPVEEVEKTYQDNCGMADFVFLPKETKVAYVGVVVVVSESIGTVMRWAKENNVEGTDSEVVSSDAFKKQLMKEFEAAAKAKKLQRFMWIQKAANIHTVYLPAGYQEEWVAGVKCPNGHTEQLLTATFKARRAQLDQYFAPAFPTMYPDRPADHILP